MFSSPRLHKIKSRLGTVLSQGFYESCCLCERAGLQGFCVDCWRQLLRCQIRSPLPTTAQRPPLIAWGRYQGGLRRAISHMKYQNKPQIATRLGEELGFRWLQQFPQYRSFVAIPIPLHRDRLLERGYNQAELIARRFSQVVGVPCQPHGLARISQTKAQHSLDPSHRKLNLEGAFIANTKYLTKRRSPILIIDDIFTTGATTLEAIRTLQQFQMPVLGSAVVAQAIYEEDDAFK